ncbi:zinc ribbon domain-containing protein [Aquisalibacillus elongatus]|uniref:Zinc-ribbon domain-containing protein n=1 Tax=Aquisalibacillus elongatus TaxID=485577 RepID=A0A3N5B4S3_9BACI|nr:zinc ribbon domain-containing protein [Aquisalibacillus elongatus]RPF52277.1 hypothetical protein EDC24_2270 [Aquisalibacillus elongatus]
MFYCPKCGAETRDEELYCVSCGSKLPTDTDERFNEPSEKGFNKWWLAPLSTLILVLLIAIIIHFYLDYQQDKAVETYEEGIELALEGQYLNAKEKFRQSLEYKSNFTAASDSMEFMDIAIEVNEELNAVDSMIEEQSFQQAINLTQDIESQLNKYNGEVINELLSDILEKRNEIKISQVKYQLEDDSSIDELKMQLYQVESINTDEAGQLEDQMKERIVNHSFNRANEELNQNHFSNALAVVNDALKYVPDNERLESLKTTIEKQQVAFETEQQERIQQALNQYEIEQENNANDAVELIGIETDRNDNDELIVSGQIKSIATVPIYSISVKYILTDQESDEVLAENETFLYPETLYPEETGQFEYTHFEIEDDVTVDVNIEQIQWYLEGQ